MSYRFKEDSLLENKELDECYDGLLTDNGFSVDENNHDYPPSGTTYRLSNNIGEGYYWIYSKKDLFDIRIHDFAFKEDFFFDFDLPGCLSITQYESISGEELNPYRRINAGCIKTFVGGEKAYKALIHKRIPVKAIGIEIMPAYYEEYLKNEYPGEYINPLEAFKTIDQTTNFPEMQKLLHEVLNYRGQGIAASLFYEGKVAEAVSLMVEEHKKLLNQTKRHLSNEDIQQLENVVSYLNDHYAYDISLERLSKIACMGTTKLKTSFKLLKGCPITEYVQNRRMSQAEQLLANTDFTIGQIAKMIDYSTSSRFAKLFKKYTGILPIDYRKIIQKNN